MLSTAEVLVYWFSLLLELTHSHVSFAGTVITIDSDRRSGFYTYIFPRLICQFVVGRYSFEIPDIVRQLSLSIENRNENDISILKNDTSNENSIEEQSGVDELEMVTLEEDVTVTLDGANNDDKTCTEHSAVYSATEEHKNKMKSFMNMNMGIFILVCVGFVIYIAASDLGSEIRIPELSFSIIISVCILINIRAFYSCVKWFWLHAYGFSAEQLDIIFSNREDSEKWSLEGLKKIDLVPRDSFFSFLLPGVGLSTEKKMRTVDAWTKKIAHTYDGLLVFILSAESFSSSEDATKTYSLAYSISLLYMLLYVFSYRDNGPLGWIIYGAKSRIMDGYLGIC